MDEQGFLSRVRPLDSGCHEWAGARSRDGYGRVYMGAGKYAAAHRFAYERVHGPIPVGLLVCHRCDNPPCVNVDHLFLGTNAENLADMSAKGRHHHPGRPVEAFLHHPHKQKDVCKNGHAYDAENTHVAPSGRRECRACDRLYYQRKKLRREPLMGERIEFDVRGTNH